MTAHKPDFNRGRSFEARVEEALRELSARHSTGAVVEAQYLVETPGSGYRLIDFRLTVRLPRMIQYVYIEVQSRKRHGHEVLDKISTIRAIALPKTFLFVHDEPLEPSIKRRASAMGVMHADLAELRQFVEGWDRTLSATGRAGPDATYPRVSGRDVGGGSLDFQQEKSFVIYLRSAA